MNKLLTIEELADFLQIKKSFIRSLVFQRKIPFIKIGRLIRFDMNEIIQWIKKETN